MLDRNGNMFLEDNDIIELMLQNRQVKILPKNTKSFETFTTQCKQHGLEVPFDIDVATDRIIWNTPIEYANLDIKNYILSKHKLDSGRVSRVELELEEFKKRNLIDLLKFLVYMMDVSRHHNIIYGVGRGSSVSSYVLYLLGVHRIDSYKYQLDIKEFLK